MINFSSCERYDSCPIILFEEKGCRIHFKNSCRHKIRIIDVECAIRAVDDSCTGRREKHCDNLFVDHKRTSHFVELKSSHVEKAIKQLEATIKTLGKHLPVGERNAYIVYRTNPLDSTTIQAEKLNFRKRHNATLHTHKSGSEVNL